MRETQCFFQEALPSLVGAGAGANLVAWAMGKTTAKKRMTIATTPNDDALITAISLPFFLLLLLLLSLLRYVEKEREKEEGEKLSA